ncbi:MAG TPA: hypothetical protein VFR58_11520 [Flavisolibacter sp.]|nr:hypothetical protein [Flavisolibacter sp.]
MKQICKNLAVMLTLLAAIFSPLLVLAQTGGADITVDINKTDNGAWYNQPWVWIVGTAVFILLLVALLRNDRSAE